MRDHVQERKDVIFDFIPEGFTVERILSDIHSNDDQMDNILLIELSTKRVFIRRAAMYHDATPTITIGNFHTVPPWLFSDADASVEEEPDPTLIGFSCTFSLLEDGTKDIVQLNFSGRNFALSGIQYEKQNDG